MHRLIVDSEALEAERPSLDAANRRHLAVVRPRDGEEVELFDGRGTTRFYRWSQREKGLVAAAALLRHAPLRCAVTLFACVTKGQRWDWIVQKATELGVARIVPVMSEHTIVRIAGGERVQKRERWQKIADEAARQSSAVFIPEVCEPVDFPAALALARKTTCFAGALVQPPPRPLLDAVRAALAAAPETPPALSLFVGPEGDFSPVEMSALLEFAVPTSFGPLVLRAETAAIFGLSVINATLHGENA